MLYAKQQQKNNRYQYVAVSKLSKANEVFVYFLTCSIHKNFTYFHW